jgi:hypothetical protein
MKCAQCQTEGGVELMAKLATGWDDPREQTYDEWHRCRHCGATYYSMLTDEFFSDNFQLETYTAEPQAWQESYELARKCPRPDDYDCKCPAHTTSRQGHGHLVRDDLVRYND